MKISVSYGDRTYGNSSESNASEVAIKGNVAHVDMKIKFKKPQPGRSWDWMSSASVGGASIEMSLSEAKALAEALLTFAVVKESDEENKLVNVTLRLREGTPPERILTIRTLEEIIKEFQEGLSSEETK